MPKCRNSQCGHCVVVSVMIGRENEDNLTNKEINEAAVKAGLNPDMALPNDHSRPYLMDDWCTVPTNCSHPFLAPNLRPYCDAHCWHGHNIFWSWIEHVGIEPNGRHIHTRPNRYKVAETLYWCDGTVASAQKSS